MGVDTNKSNMKPALVVINGWAMPRHVWGEVYDWLDSLFDLYFFDIDQALTLDQWQERLLENTPDQAVWMGWSLGAQLAMSIAETAPEKVQKLILLTSTPCFLENKEAENIWQNGQTIENFENLRRLVTKSATSLIKRFALLQTLGSSADRSDSQAIVSRVDVADPVYEKPVLLSGLSLLEQIDSRNWLKHTKIPAHFILGEHDNVVLVKREDLHSLNTDVTVDVIPSMGHFPFLSAASDLVRVLGKRLNVSSESEECLP